MKLLSILMTTFLALTPIYPPTNAVFAEEILNFEKSNVLDDLQSDKNFNLMQYPYNTTGSIEVINVLEYCYSHDKNNMSDYGLYVYVYNPQGLELSTKSGVHKITLGVAYNGEQVTDYEKFFLELVNSSTGDYNNLFYKFKVIDHKSADGLTISERVNSNGRRYDISEIELAEKDNSTATAYSVSATYIYSGYAKGYGPDESAESTLKCELKKLETIQLDVKHTFYRSQTSSLGVGHQNQLETVYFRVPNRFLEEYGTLQRIKAEWYEYKTKEIVVTENTDFYNAAKPYIGAVLPNYELGGTVTGSVYNQDIGYSLALNLGDGGDIDFAEWGWNLGTEYLHTPCEALYYMFLVEDIQSYDPYADVTENGGVQSNSLYDYIMGYDKTFNDGTLPIKGGSISADLFEDDIDESRKINNANGKIQKGYSYYDFDADVDLVTLKSWSDTSPSFWENWVNCGLGAGFTGGPTEESKTVAPIQILKSGDLSGTAEEVSSRLLVNYADVPTLRDEQTKAEKNGETLVLFRFAQSDYYSQEVDIVQLNQGFLWADIITSGEAYIAQESVFLDFDIIQLTFNRQGELSIIPAVSSPIDIVDDVTPPIIVTEQENNVLKLILQIIALVLIIWLSIKLISVIAKGISRAIKK